MVLSFMELPWTRGATDGFKEMENRPRKTLPPHQAAQAFLEDSRSWEMLLVEG